MARPPLSIPPTSTAPLKVTLLLGSYLHSPLKIELFDLYVPASHPPIPHPDEASFHPLPAIEHTFRPEQRLPPKPISAAFAALVLSPWVVLFGLVRQSICKILSPPTKHTIVVQWAQISPRVPRLFSPSILPFTLTLGAFEGLLIWYWIALKLGQVLLYGSILGVITIFTGRHALASIGDRRVGRK